jgi:hypothetical protein
MRVSHHTCHTDMSGERSVRKTVSLPSELATWAEEHARDRGHDMLSRTVAEALRHLRKSQMRKMKLAGVGR